MSESVGVPIVGEESWGVSPCCGVGVGDKLGVGLGGISVLFVVGYIWCVVECVGCVDVLCWCSLFGEGVSSLSCVFCKYILSSSKIGIPPG